MSIAAASAGAGCKDSPGDSAAPPLELPEPDSGEAGLQDCAPALSLSPTEAVVGPDQLVTLRPSGGTGDWRLALEGDPEAGTLNADDGVFLAGDTPGTEATVLLTDGGCLGEARAVLRVAGPLSVSPARVTLRPGAAFEPEVTGGSGEVTCALAQADSGASVGQGCRYQAGSGEGFDRLVVTDAVTGDWGEVRVTVDAEARLRMDGEGRVVLPLGASFRPRVQGGSGVVDLAVAGAALGLADGAAVGSAEGEGTLTVTDRFAGLSLETPVTVAAPWGPDLPRDGERSGHGVVLPLGDVDGDGYDDFAVASIEPSLGAYYSGGVMIWAGGPGGPDAAPVQVIAGEAATETAGRAVAAGDLDGDGLTDLVVGVDKRDPGLTNAGEVHIHFGRPDGFFEETPGRVLRGELAYDRFGAALAVCDFDADGWLDLAVGAVDAADVAVASPAWDQGSVHVFRGAEDGFADRASFVLHGVLPDGNGGWAPAPGMHLGEELTAADLDGDGLCDLVAGAPEAAWDGVAAEGVVLAWPGTTRDGLLLERSPGLLLALGEGDGAELGHALATGDLDGDGAADVVAGAWRSDRNRNLGGAVLVFRGGPWPEDATDAITVEDWSQAGETGLDYLGTDVHVADLDGDGRPELLASAYRAEEPNTPRDAGQVMVFDGARLRDELGGATRAGPTSKVAGPEAWARFGQAAAGVGDVDGDGVGDIVGLAGLDNAYGVEVGAPWLAARAGQQALVRLDFPGEASGHEIGQGLALLDLDGDGRDELVVGAPGAGEPTLGANAGSVVAWPADTTDREAWSAWAGYHPTHSSSDHFGYTVVPAGDFDGDGWADVAVLARKASWGGAPDGWSTVGSCGGSRSQVGAVLVYRGGPAGVATTPAFAWYGPAPEDYTPRLAPAGDVDDDGYDDLIVAGQDWDEVGGYALVRGRAAGSTPLVLCNTTAVFGFDAFDRLGSAVAGLGDLDGDGCDEVAVGASGEDFHSDWYNQGVVRVLWGWGGAGCPSRPEVTTLALRVIGTEAGGALAGGGDVDGDGLFDLVVGASAYRVTFAEVGAAWLVPGDWLLRQPRVAMPGGALPAQETSGFSPMLPEDGDIDRLGLVGRVAGGLFGQAVALAPDPVDPRRAAVVVGAPLGDEGGTALAGGVRLHRYLPGEGLDDVAWAVVAGESADPGGELGLVIVVGADGALAVGAPTSDALGLDQGAAYLLRLP